MTLNSQRAIRKSRRRASKKFAATTPEIEKTVSETVQVFKQTVDVMDLKTVIKAVNGME